jgi:hypothetical protein
MRLTIKIDTSDLDFDIAKLEKAIDQELNKTAHKIERTAKELAPVDSGDLRRSINTSGSKLKYEVSTNVEYAHFMEYGTSLHKITGNPWLRWKPNYFRVKTVYHTGNKAYRYMSKAFDSHTETLEQRIAQIVGDVL